MIHHIIRIFIKVDPQSSGTAWHKTLIDEFDIKCPSYTTAAMIKLISQLYKDIEGNGGFLEPSVMCNPGTLKTWHQWSINSWHWWCSGKYSAFQVSFVCLFIYDYPTLTRQVIRVLYLAYSHRQLPTAQRLWTVSQHCLYVPPTFSGPPGFWTRDPSASAPDHRTTSAPFLSQQFLLWAKNSRCTNLARHIVNPNWLERSGINGGQISLT